MRKKIFLKIIISIFIISLGASLYSALFLLNKQQAKISSISKLIEDDNKNRLAILNIEKEDKKENIQDPNYIQSSSYFTEVSEHSKIDKQSKGTLILLKHKLSGIKFVTAFSDDVNIDSLPLSAEWEASKLSVDSMWIPAQCAQKPSWLISNRHYLMDDGATFVNASGGGDTHYYAIYDLEKNNFTRFGGNNLTNFQNREKVLSVMPSGDKLIFIIDTKDSTGEFANHPNYKHSIGNKNKYLIKRVIDPVTLKYDDYKINYYVPEGLDGYYLQVLTTQNSSLETLSSTPRYTLSISTAPGEFYGSNVSNFYLSKLTTETTNIDNWQIVKGYTDRSNYLADENIDALKAKNNEYESEIKRALESQNEQSKIGYIEIINRYNNRIIYTGSSQDLTSSNLATYNLDNGTTSVAFDNPTDFFLSKIIK